jgi:dTDP-4-dehydrorhamnose 3,5-epimerase
MDVSRSAIDGLCVIQVKTVEDDRGAIREFFRGSSWTDAGLPTLSPWAQFNITVTRQGTIRGLHGEAMNKLVGIAAGAAFGAYVDARPDSPTRGALVTVPLAPGTQVFVPQGVCNGFQSTSEGGCTYVYCFDNEWQPGMSGVAVHALDPALGIPWPLAVDLDDPASISEKDRALPTLEEALRSA